MIDTLESESLRGVPGPRRLCGPYGLPGCVTITARARMATARTSYRFTVDDFHRMAVAGVFTEDDRVELLEGEITVMTPIGDRHISAVDFLTDRLGEALRARALVRVQSPVRLGPHTAPQPDIT